MNKGKNTIKIYCKPNERAEIARSARETGISLSAYARTLALGRSPVTIVELDELKKVMRVHADLGRLGGLLKMFLTNDERLNDMGREMGWRPSTARLSIFAPRRRNSLNWLMLY